MLAMFTAVQQIKEGRFICRHVWDAKLPAISGVIEHVHNFLGIVSFQMPSRVITYVKWIQLPRC